MDDPIADFKKWYLTRPPITRAFLTSSALISVLITTEVISIHKLYYTFSDTVYNFELWRPITSLLFLGNFGIYFIFKAYFAYFALLSA
jgi:Derlin-2/3